MKNILVVFGTRPEAIKMCPLIKELKKRKDISVRVISTGQHGDMLSSVLSFFSVTPDYELGIMSRGQTLLDITQTVMRGMEAILKKDKCDLVLVHGDTSSAFAASLAAFYMHIPIGHVEAGLRTHDVNSPYPEEFNRVAIDAVSSYYFAPTDSAAENLLCEGRRKESVFVTGNTVIDALKYTVKKDFSHELLVAAHGKKLVLITAHRRENTEKYMCGMFESIARILSEYNDIFAVFPMHPNPCVRSLAKSVFSGVSGISLLEPLDVFTFHNIIARSHLILTDSGGIQEEAACLGVPLLIMRDTTERTEAVEAGAARLIGNTKESIYRGIRETLEDNELYKSMMHTKNPYGNGDASVKIADIIDDI